MIQTEDIRIEHLIVHILDTSMSIPVMSMEEMSISIDISAFIAGHIARTLNDESLKDCEFIKENNLFLNALTDYKNTSTEFVTFSKQIAGQLFSIMEANIDIPSADLAIVLFHYDQKDYLALLKLNYQNTFIHYTDYETEVNINSIIQHRTTLPGSGQRIGEAAIINLETQTLKLLDKAYEINGQKTFYLSSLFFKCHTGLSSKEQMQAVKTATNKVTKKFFDTDPEKKAEITEKLYSHLDDQGQLNLKSFAEETFTADNDAKEIFFDTLEKRGLEAPTISISEKTIQRTFDKQKIKTDEGIELKIPINFYNDPDKIEFVTEANGKISIILKNINKLL